MAGAAAEKAGAHVFDQWFSSEWCQTIADGLDSSEVGKPSGGAAWVTVAGARYGGAQELLRQVAFATLVRRDGGWRRPARGWQTSVVDQTP